MTDEQLAQMLQEAEDLADEEEEEQRRRAQHERHSDMLSDQELARRLQAEEAGNSHSRAPPGHLHQLGEMVSCCREWLPYCATNCGCGANVDPRIGACSGCLIGLQLGALLSLGNAALCVCMLAGAAIGHSSSGQHQQSQPTYEADSESSSDHGLDARVIDNHTIDHVFHSSTAPAEGGAADENKCMICMEIFVEGDGLRALPCLHRYHKACVDEWLCRRPECPICKRDVTQAQTLPPAAGMRAPRSRSNSGRMQSLGAWARRGVRSGRGRPSAT